MEVKEVYMTEEQIEERKAKVAAIEGLAEIQAAIADCRNAVFAEDIIDKIHKLGELRAKYPRADAYLEADRWIHSENPVKVRLGSRAMEQILDGEDPEAAILEMSRITMDGKHPTAPIVGQKWTEVLMMATEKRLIDANELLKDARRNKPIAACLADIVDIQDLINDQPTVEAESVVHGRWIYGTRAAVCSECGFERHLDDNFGAAIACPNCWAKMDRKDDSQCG